jgi:hypothetical protein
MFDPFEEDVFPDPENPNGSSVPQPREKLVSDLGPFIFPSEAVAIILRLPLSELPSAASNLNQALSDSDILTAFRSRFLFHLSSHEMGTPFSISPPVLTSLINILLENTSTPDADLDSELATCILDWSNEDPLYFLCLAPLDFTHLSDGQWLEIIKILPTVCDAGGLASPDFYRIVTQLSEASWNCGVALPGLAELVPDLEDAEIKSLEARVETGQLARERLEEAKGRARCFWEAVDDRARYVDVQVGWKTARYHLLDITEIPVFFEGSE